ncbi:MAG TPA: TonB family protein [Thermoanaerobaculia bacterium]
MRDAVAEVLAQREQERATSLGSMVAVSVVLHLALFGFMIAGARRAQEPPKIQQLNIRFAGSPAPIARPGRPASKPAAVKKDVKSVPKPEPPKVEEAKPVKKEAYAPKQESIFGRSDKKVPAREPAREPEPGSAAPGTGVQEGFSLPGVGSAGVTGLEGGDFPYTIYVNQMLSKIGRGWSRPQAGELLAQVYFVIERDGRVRDVEIERSSGSAAFDRAALRAVIDSSPLPPLPFGYSGTWLGVHLTFH